MMKMPPQQMKCSQRSGEKDEKERGNPTRTGVCSLIETKPRFIRQPLFANFARHVCVRLLSSIF
jgi:hypothetical protein